MLSYRRRLERVDDDGRVSHNLWRLQRGGARQNLPIGSGWMPLQVL